MNRDDFRRLSEVHLEHAQVLLNAGLYSGAYYICGYVVECALKACICGRTSQFDFFSHPEVARKAWSHRFVNLIEVSGLEEDFTAARKADRALDVNWKSVDDWSEDSRYEPRGQKEAEGLLAAVSDPEHGVLSCIKRFW
jgi:HEPN domain-containing protein